MWATTQDRKETEQKGRKQKESEMSGEVREQGERRARKRTSGADRARVRIPPVSRGVRNPGLVLSPYRNLASPVHQVRRVNQQVDGCQDGHSQSLVPEAHVIVEPIDAAHITGPVGLSAKLLIELVEQPEDQALT